MEVFLRLVLGHLIGDFTLQTNYIAAWKRRNLWGMAVHCGIHPILYTVLLWNYMGQVWMRIGDVSFTGWTCVLLIFIAHFVEDEWRVWSVLKKGAPDNTFFYLWDQVIHYAVLFAISPVVDGGATSKFGFIHYPPLEGVVMGAQAAGLGAWQRFLTVTRPEPWVLAGSLLVIVTHFTTVSIYFIEKDVFGKDFPAADEKYISMAERMVVTGCFLLPGIWWAGLIAVWFGWVVLSKIRDRYDFSWTSIVVGNLTAVACGLLLRGIFY
ncbi:MAG: hypothetical protein A2902_02525 [Elusimicrobia bacterium RIFCSPLOWO2_01_FULL_64_13]|nr:MAG: hypothetical protein A2902_02525 [Elusimicrobia bacterium RIFCSPLOWO2_01_FULL_64_13]